MTDNNYVRNYIINYLKDIGINDIYRMRKLIYDYFDEIKIIPKEKYVVEASKYIQAIVGNICLSASVARIIIEDILKIVSMSRDIEQLLLIGKGNDLRGLRFGKLTVNTCLGVDADKKGRSLRWLCICDCGNVVNVNSNSLIRKMTQSCGCYNKEILSKKATTHGMSKHIIYGTYYRMIQRCYNQNNNQYKDYGGRGITVCDCWMNSFEKFYEDMGDRPEGMSLDRINNDGNYEPENCQWATKEQQMNNRRITLRFNDGEPIAMFAKNNTIPYDMVSYYYEKGFQQCDILNAYKKQY